MIFYYSDQTYLMFNWQDEYGKDVIEDQWHIVLGRAWLRVNGVCELFRSEKLLPCFQVSALWVADQHLEYWGLNHIGIEVLEVKGFVIF